MLSNPSFRVAGGDDCGGGEGGNKEHLTAVAAMPGFHTLYIEREFITAPVWASAFRFCMAACIDKGTRGDSYLVEPHISVHH